MKNVIRSWALARRAAGPYVVEQFRTQQLDATRAATELEISRRRPYRLYHEYLKAHAAGQHAAWTPSVSVGDHAAPWSDAVVALLRKRLNCQPPSSYSFAASEALRVCGFKLDRTQVRRWAIGAGLAHAGPILKTPTPVKRWQRSQISELWQLDCSPHRWFAGVSRAFPLLNLLDDCSRLHLGARLYERKLLLGYLDFLPPIFGEYGLPLELYVDYHSIFSAKGWTR